MSVVLPPAADRHSAEDSGGWGPRGRSKLQVIAAIGATSVLLAAGGLVLLTRHPHRPGPVAGGCGLVPCSATVPATQPPSAAPSPAASTHPAVKRSGSPARASASAPAPARASQPPPTPQPTAPASIGGFFDNSGITDNTSTSAGNLDGSGYSLSEQALAAAGVTPGSVIRYGSARLSWPGGPAGQADNIVSSGQTVAMNGSGRVLAFLVTATWGPASGTGTIRYTDGTSQPFRLGAPDWFQPPPFGSAPVIAMRYRNGPGNWQDGSHPAYVYYASVPLASGKNLQAVVLPAISGPVPRANRPALHIFAMTAS